MQGASRGLGLEFVKQLLDKPDHRYMAHVLNIGMSSIVKAGRTANTTSTVC